jgi:uncharacterized protein YqeY
MNPIQTRLVADMKAAMKAGEKDRLGVIRMLIAALKDAQLQGADDQMDEAAELQVLRKQVKSRRDSVDQALKAGRPEIAEKEQAEIAVIEAYLPATLQGEALLAKVREVAAEVGYQGPQDKGRFMKVWMSRHRDLAEGRDVQAALGQLESS